MANSHRLHAFAALIRKQEITSTAHCVGSVLTPPACRHRIGFLQNFDGSQRWHDKARLNRQTERNQMNKRLQEAPRVSQHAGAKVAKRFVLQQRKLQAHPCIAASPAGVLLIRIDAMWSRCHAVNLWLPLPTPSPATPATGSCRCRSGAAGRRSPPGEELCKRPYADATSS